MKTVEVWRAGFLAQAKSFARIRANRKCFWLLILFFWGGEGELERGSLLSLTFWKSAHWRWILSKSLCNLCTFSCTHGTRRCTELVRITRREHYWGGRSSFSSNLSHCCFQSKEGFACSIMALGGRSSVLGLMSPAFVMNEWPCHRNVCLVNLFLVDFSCSLQMWISSDFSSFHSHSNNL